MFRKKGLIAAFFPALALFTGCRDAPDLCTAPQDGDTEGLLSPSDGAVIRVPWVPLVVNVPDSMAKSTGAVWIDGECATDPLAQFASRYTWLGDGMDYIATLDMRDLEPGEHRLDVHIGDVGASRWVSSHFVWDPPPIRVTLRIDEDRAARVMVFRDGERLNLFGPDMDLADPGLRDIQLSSVFVLGEAVIDLDPGHYTFLAVRSLLDEVDVVDVDLTEDTELWLSVPPSVFLPGWSTGDFHVHTAASKDGFTPLRVRFESLIAAGLDVAVLTDHDLITDPTLAQALVAGPGATQHGIPGIEASVYVPDDDDDGQRESMGHINVFPTTPGSEPPNTNITNVGTYLDDWRAWGRENPFEGIDDPLIELNHPRGIQFFPDERPQGIHDMFSAFGFDNNRPVGEGVNAWMLEPGPGGSTPLDFDAMELINRFSWDLYIRVRDDWFALLNQGHFIAATGNSDSHALEVELAGMTVNLIPCPATVDLDLPCIIDAVRAGRNLVSTGPIVTFAVVDEAGQSFGPGETVKGPVTAEIRVQAAPWVPVSRVDLIVNGRLAIRTWVTEDMREADGRLDATFQLPLTLSKDAWVIVEAMDLSGEDAPPRLYETVAPGYVSLGFTNPVWVDVDGDGTWTPPGLD